MKLCRIKCFFSKHNYGRWIVAQEQAKPMIHGYLMVNYQRMCLCCKNIESNYFVQDPNTFGGI